MIFIEKKLVRAAHKTIARQMRYIEKKHEQKKYETTTTVS